MGNFKKLGVVAGLVLVLGAWAPVSAQTISVDLDRNTAGIQDTLNTTQGSVVQGAVVIDGIANYRGFTLRVKVDPLDAVDPANFDASNITSDITVTLGDFAPGGAITTLNGGSDQGILMIRAVLLQLIPTDFSGPFPAAMINFDLTLSGSAAGPIALSIIEKGQDGFNDQIVQTSSGSLDMTSANFTLAGGTISYGAPADTPTPTPTEEVPTPTPTRTPDIPVDTPTPTPTVEQSAQLIALDGFGGFHPQGGAPDLLNKESFYPGFDIVRDFEILPDNSGVVAIDGYGASVVLPFEGGSPKLLDTLAEVDRAVLPPWTPGLDQYVAVVATDDSNGYWILSEAGQIFGVGSALPAGATESLLIDLALDLTPGAGGQGVNRAVDFAVVQDSGAVQAVVVLTSYGKQLVAAGDASILGVTVESGVITGGGAYDTPFFGWDISRDIDLEPNGAGYMILEGFGGIHPVAGARAAYDDNPDTVEAGDGFLIGPRPGEPPANGGHVYFGWDVAEKIAYTSSGTGLVMIDAYGGNHFDGTIVPVRTVYFGFDIARDIEIYEAAAPSK